MDKSDKPARREAIQRPSIPGYQLMDCIGQGSTGTVFRAVQLSLQREVAIKVLPAELAKRTGFIERFLHEARAAGAVHHPNVLTCYDAGEADGVVYQALELMTGGDLSHHLQTQGGKLPYKDSLQIVLECAKGLDGIHRAGLVHGDLKLTNVFVAVEANALVIKLGDLGLARSLASDGSGPWEDSETASYATLAPEHCVESAAADIRSDVYALGAILFQLVTGQPPYEARTRQAIVEILRNRPLPDPQAVDAALPGTLTAVVQRAMAREASDRYQAPAQLREDLERLYFDFVPIHARLGDDSSRNTAQFTNERRTTSVLRRNNPLGASIAASPEAAVAAPAKPSSNLLVIAGIAGATVLVIAVAAFMILGKGREAPPAAGTTTAPVETVTGPAWKKPSWATAHGDDVKGRWADLKIGDAVQRFRRCPGGAFTMGSPSDEKDRREDEAQVPVTLNQAYWIGDSEVTQELWKAVMGANPSIKHGTDLPVENVSWQDCQQFTQRVNARLSGVVFRLPTEAEWEYARRAGGKTDSGAWTDLNAQGTTHPVRGLEPNAWGLYDMSGNVLEWCQDLYGPYPTKAVTDPVGWTGIKRVARGGAWSMPPSEARPAARAKYLPVVTFFFLGLRLAVND